MFSSRRKFIKQSALAASGLITAPAILSKTSGLLPSDTITVGLIGCRSMGFFDLQNCLRQEGVVCGALCDVDGEVLAGRAKDVEEEFGMSPKLYRDFRDLLADPGIDAVVIGTPDHWHSLMTIMACEAGKAVYVEKPLANSLAECEAMVAAVRRNESIVQVGQQQRSGQHWKDVVEYVQSGAIGQVRRVEVWANFAYGKGNPRIPNQAVPTHLDYELWQGPAASRPYNPNRLHGAWRHTWNYGGGLLTDWGVHLLDIVNWTMGYTTPRQVMAAGGIYQYTDHLIETPDTLDVVYDMEDYVLHYSHVAGKELGKFGRTYGIAFMGTKGVAVVNRQGWEVYGTSGNTEQEVVKAFAEGKDSNHLEHANDFIQAIRENRDPSCPIEMGRNAAAIAQYGIISYRSGQAIRPAAGTKGLLLQSELRPFVKPPFRSPWIFPHW